MKATIANFTTLTAMPDGTNLQSRIILDSGSFIQIYNTTSKQVQQNSSWNESTGPKFHISTKDNDGTDYTTTLQNFIIVYNGTEIAVNSDNFDTNGLLKVSKAGLPVGAIKKSVVNGITYFQFVKDVFSATNDDQDVFYVKSDVTVDDVTMQQQTMEQPIEIVRVSEQGATYYVTCSSTDVDKDGKDGSVRCFLHSTQNPNENIDLTKTGFSVQWFKLGDNGSFAEVANATSATLTVSKDSIHGLALYRADIKVDGKIFSGYAQIADHSDPYYLSYIEEGRFDDGFSGQHVEKMVQKHETVTMTAVVTDSDGKTLTGTGVTATMTVRDKDGNKVDEYSGKSSFKVSYSDLVTKCKRQMGIYLVGSQGI